MIRPHGWAIIDKPLGLTSAQVVGRIKGSFRRTGIRDLKIGHGGTLDPLATGALPIALGEATKLAGFLLNGRKGYVFAIRFGSQTATDDAEGETVATSDVKPDAQAITAVLPRFMGAIRQRPPAYSALKVDGRRAYSLARAGKPPELAERTITIYDLKLLSVDGDLARFAVSASKGTYVRSLARDLALALGSVGHVAELRRTHAGRFTLDDAISLDNFTELVQTGGLEQVLKPLTAGLDDIPALAVDPEDAKALKQGKRLSGSRAQPGHYIATEGPVPVALVEATQHDLRVVRGFNF
ncbi:MAG: tRNA pseudouridine(55) synthase TruB [Sphingomonadaceae bacterium]